MDRCGASQLTWSVAEATESLKMPAVGGKDADFAGLVIKYNNVVSVVNRNTAHASKETRTVLIAPNPQSSGCAKQVVPSISPALQCTCRQIPRQRVGDNERGVYRNVLWSRMEHLIAWRSTGLAAQDNEAQYGSVPRHGTKRGTFRARRLANGIRRALAHPDDLPTNCQRGSVHPLERHMGPDRSQ